jgi:phosphatidylglycerophosphatase A
VKRLIVTFFGSGYLPIAPGTWGSAAAIVCFAAVYAVSPHAICRNGTIGLLTVVACIASIACGPWAVAHFGRKDPKPFVLDEVAGQWVALLGLPLVDPRTAVAAMALQFVLFRILDIIKPPPARQLESLPHGWGILFDDLASGLYANLIGQAFFRCFWPALTLRIFA